MKLLFLTLTLTFACILVKGQDYIVTWNNDTIPCRMPPKPAKEGLKQSRKYENGYDKFVAIFSADSLRIIEAGQVKSYKREKHGRRLLCDGVFDAKKIAGTSRKQIAESDKDKKWVFMQRVKTGPFVKLYQHYKRDNDGCAISYYYLSFAGDNPNNVVYVDSKESAIKLLMKDTDVAQHLEKLKYRKSSNGFIDIVEGYNRLKQEAANNTL